MMKFKFWAIGLFTFFLFAAFVTEIKLEVKTFFNDKVEMKIPVGFQTMPDELIKDNYPSLLQPTIVYTDESGAIKIALNLTQHNANQDLIPNYETVFSQLYKKIYASTDWRDKGVDEINERKVGYLELLTSDKDSETYNLSFFTDLDDKVLLCTFNCPKKSIDEWAPVAHKIMNSLKIIN